MRTIIHLLTRLALLAGLLAQPLTAPALELPPGCQAGVPATCLYRSDEAYAQLRQFDFQFVDAGLGEYGHVVPFRVTWPAHATGRLPLVIWIHDGGVTRPTTVNGNLYVEGMSASERRVNSFAAAGYVVVRLGRTRPTSEINMGHCIEIGLGPPPAVWERCTQLIGNFEYGPKIVRNFVRRLNAGAALLPAALANRVDLNRIVIAGRGIGSVILYNTAGVRLHWEPAPGKQRPMSFAAVSVPGVVAYYADSPESPTLTGVLGNGLGDADLFNLSALPLMLMSGRGDLTGDRPRAARSAPWQIAPAGDKYMAWVRSEQVDGATIGLDAEGCNSPAQAAACEVLEMLGVAYLDAVVKRKPGAINWLASDAIRVAGADAIELHRR